MVSRPTGGLKGKETAATLAHPGPGHCLFGLWRTSSSLQASVLPFIKWGEQCFLCKVIIMIRGDKGLQKIPSRVLSTHHSVNENHLYKRRSRCCRLCVLTISSSPTSVSLSLSPHTHAHTHMHACKGEKRKIQAPG